MRVPHPVRARVAQLLRRRGPLVLDRIGDQHEEPPQHAPQPRAFDARAVPVETRDKRRRRVPAHGRDRQAALREVLVERRPGQRRQSPSRACPLAEHV